VGLEGNTGDCKLVVFKFRHRDAEPNRNVIMANISLENMTKYKNLETVLKIIKTAFMQKLGD
jgi:hypothetical protein